MQALDFEMRFAVAGDGWHAQAGTIENRDAEAFYQRRAQQTQRIEIKVELGTLIHITGENDARFMGDNLL